MASPCWTLKNVVFKNNFPYIKNFRSSPLVSPWTSRLPYFSTEIGNLSNAELTTLFEEINSNDIQVKYTLFSFHMMAKLVSPSFFFSPNCTCYFFTSFLRLATALSANQAFANTGSKMPKSFFFEQNSQIRPKIPLKPLLRVSTHLFLDIYLHRCPRTRKNFPKRISRTAT